MSNTEPVSPDITDADRNASSALQRERDELYDRLLRTTAEFDNYRKRTDRERREQSEFAAADLVRDLLPILDDMERALAAPVEEASAQVASYRNGIELILRQFMDVLKRRGVEPLDVVGQRFDPEWHEAIGHETIPGFGEGQITSEVRRGYRLGSRLLRPAMVKVAS
jgi:molecular chaperone GrpE